MTVKMGTRTALTRKELAEALSVSIRTVEAWALRREGPPYLIVGGKALYPLDWLDTWLDAQPRGGEER
jgi:helix-turn-helix protein